MSVKNKLGLGIGILLLLIIVAGAYYIFRPADTIPNRTASEVDVGDTKKACDIFSSAIARKVFGPSAERSEAISSDAQTSSATIAVTSCSYETGGAIATVLVRAAKADKGRSTNDFGFYSLRTQGSGEEKKLDTIPIEGLGDAAYYNPAYSQVNVLAEQGKYWIAVQVGQDRDAAEKLARAILENL